MVKYQHTTITDYKYGKGYINMLRKIYLVFNETINKRNLFILSIYFMLSCFAITYAFFRGAVPYDRFSWIFWIVSIVLLCLSIYRKPQNIDVDTKKILLFVLAVTAVYFITHLWNYNIAPWNSNGLFDDAAWDIYFVQDYKAPGSSFQIAFNDLQIGRIGRELVFHNFIGIWFKIFGYNLFMFNMALIFLGYITVLFTSLLAYRIFNNFAYAAVAAIFINFFPMHYTQVFMGHRYAICAPLMMVSMYFLYHGYKSTSQMRMAVGGVFAALCMSSAIMGKQYIYALVGTIILLFILNFRKRKEIYTKLPLLAVGAVGFLFASVPLFSYILVNSEIYSMRESSLISDFFARIKIEGLKPLWENVRIWYETMFSNTSYQRQFMHEFPILSWTFLLFVIVGAVESFMHKHYYIALMIAVTIAGSFVTICYDFRLLISAPFYVLSIVFAFHAIVSLIKNYRIRYLVLFVLTLCLIISPVKYLFKLSSSTNGQYLLPHTSVAASRFIQDVVAGEDEPDFKMEKDEFNRVNNNSEYDTLAATKNSYAHVHAFLHDYDAFKILKLLNNFPYSGKDPNLLQKYFTNSIFEYKKTNKDLMIVMEKGDEIYSIMELLNSYADGSVKEYSENIDGIKLEIFTVRIPKEYIEDFKSYISSSIN